MSNHSLPTPIVQNNVAFFFIFNRITKTKHVNFRVSEIVNVFRDHNGGGLPFKGEKGESTWKIGLLIVASILREDAGLIAVKCFERNVK